MRNYEVAFVIHPEVDDEGLNALTEKVQSWITSGGGSIEKVERLGRKKLAYEIRKQREGHYVLVFAKMSAAAPLDVERNLRLTEQVLRFMIMRLDGEPAPVPPVVAEEPAPATA